MNIFVFFSFVFIDFIFDFQRQLRNVIKIRCTDTDGNERHRILPERMCVLHSLQRVHFIRRHRYIFALNGDKVSTSFE